MAHVRRLAPWTVLLVALAMLALMLVPAKVWDRPANDAVYEGFDPNLVFVSERGDGSAEGAVEVRPQSLAVTALPNSRPTVHLATTPKSFKAAMDVRILSNGEATTPLRIGLWDPRSMSGRFLEFGPAPDNLIAAQTVVNGRVGKTLISGEVIRNDALGQYSLGQLYHVEITLDRKAGTLQTSLSGAEMPPSGGPMLKVGDVAEGLREILSPAVSVQGGEDYAFGGQVKLLHGNGPYAIGIYFWDKEGNRLPFANNWRPITELNGWTASQVRTTAPPEAAVARVFLGSGSQTVLLFADTFLTEADRPYMNLLPNGDFREGAKGWREAAHPGYALEVIQPYSFTAQFVVTAEEAPEIVRPFRPTLTIDASSRGGFANATVENYSLTLPPQRFPVIKVDDDRARLLVLSLLAAGALLCLVQVTRWVGKARRHLTFASGEPSRWRSGSAVIYIYSLPVLLLAAVAVLAYLILNALLFRFGSPHFDVVVAQIWSYTAARYDLTELYMLTPVTTAAEVFTGIPWSSALFPYGLTKAYYYLSLGWLDGLFFNASAFSADSTSLEFLIKFFNVGFGLADGVLIYLILREMKLSQRSALLAAAFFLFNPAVWFIMSIWGSTETVSLFFIFASIWLAEKKQPFWAWLALVAGAFTRPQMLVPAFLLGLVYLRKFALKENIMAISWCVILFFLFLGPFALKISPSVPVDYLSTIFRSQVVEGATSAAERAVSPGNYSIWTLPLMFSEGQSGMRRLWYPEDTPLIGSLSYGQMGVFVTGGFLLLVAAALLLRRGVADSARDYVPFVALGVLGWLLFSTSLIARYFLYGLAFVILCRKSLDSRIYYSMLSAMTVVLLVTVYGHLALDVLGYRDLGHVMHPDSNPVSRFTLDLFFTDWFITMGTIANMLVLAWLALETFTPLRIRWPRRQVALERAAALE